MYKIGTIINTEKYLNWLMSQISMTYGDIKYKQLFVCGDGAGWIKNIAKDLNALFILDKFHLFQVLRKCFSYRKKGTANYHIYNFLTQVIKNDHDINSAIIVLQDLLKNTTYWQNEYDKENVREALNYIKNNYSGIDIWKRKDICTGCYAESNISHLIKSVKGYGAKIYNVKTFTNLLYLKLAIVNKVRLIEFIRSETEEEFNILISKNRDFEFLDDKKYKLKNISIPILNHKDTGLKIKLKTIIYKY